MDLPALRVLEAGSQSGSRSGFRHAAQHRQLGNGGQNPRPDDVIDREIIAEDHGAPLVQVDHGGIARLVDAEVVEKTAVLPEGIGVVPVVHGAFLVAEKQQHTGLEAGFQAFAAINVGLGGEHAHISFLDFGHTLQQQGPPGGGPC